MISDDSMSDLEDADDNDDGAQPFNVRSGKFELPKFKPILRYSKKSVGQADPSQILVRDTSEVEIEGGMSKSIVIILHGKNLYSWVQQGNDNECATDQLNWISTVDICGFKIDQSDQLYFLY